MKSDRTVRLCMSPRVRMAFTCSQRWSDLAPTEAESERLCAHCEMRVYFCATDEETLEHARAGHCIAREEPVGVEPPYAVLGRPESPPAQPTEEQMRAWSWKRREDAIAEALASAGPSARECPECRYPVPRWRVSCYVCGHELGRAE